MMVGTALSAEEAKQPSVERAILDRLDKLEAHQSEKKTLLERLGVWGGLVALLISISTGVFTIYDEAITKPVDEKDKKTQQFESIIASIATLSQELATKTASITDTAVKQQIGMLYNAQLLVLVRNAESIESQIREQITAPGYLILGNAELALGNIADAQRFLKLASERKTDPSTHAEILRFLGRALAMSNTPEGLTSARRAFDESGGIMIGFSQFGAPLQRANLLGDRLIAEAWFGDCNQLPELTTKFLAEVTSPGVLPEAVKALRINLSQNLQNQTRCTWERAAIMPPPS